PRPTGTSEYSPGLQSQRCFRIVWAAAAIFDPNAPQGGPAVTLRAIAFVASIFLVTFAAVGGAFAQAGAPWGIDSGRATDEDVFNSVSDFIALKSARDKLQTGVLDQVAAERQKELLGIAPDQNLLATLAPKLGQQFLDNVFPIALKLVKNPAVP